MTYGSKHFTVEQVTDGIWTTLHKQGGSHICNSGIIDLGEETLVFDTGLCLESARDLKETATKLTGKTPTLVVNSHLHNDHFYGNQVFTEAEKITSKKNVLITIPKWKTDIDKSYSWAKNTIENASKLLNSESEYEREYAKIFMGYLQGIIDVAPLLHYTPNDVTFNDHLSLEGSRRRVEIIEYLDADIVVPGHGSVGTVSAFDDTKEYILTVENLVRKVIANSGSIEDAESIPVPEKYREYKMRDFFYKRNLRKLFNILKE